MTSGVTTPIQQEDSGATDAATSQAPPNSYSNSAYFGANGTETGAHGSASPNGGANSTNSAALNQYSTYGRAAMSQYMQDSYHYAYGASTQPGGASSATSGADSPTATAAALAAYYGSSAGFGAGATAPSASASLGYASYYNNYMAASYFNHQAGYGGAYGASTGTGTGAGSHSANGAPAQIYHLNPGLPPPAITEPGTNSLDDVLKSPGKIQFKNTNYYVNTVDVLKSSLSR